MFRAWPAGARLLVFSIVAAALLGCAPVVRSEQAQRTHHVPLEAGHSVGQTFQANFDGLAGVEVESLEAAGEGCGLRLTLRGGPSFEDTLAAAAPAQRIMPPGGCRFTFSPVSNSAQQSFYFNIENHSASPLLLAAGPGPAYLDGALYLDNAPQDAQMTFRLVYDPVRLAAGLLNEGLAWAGALALFGVLFVLPGWALLAAWPAFSARTLAERAALACGVGLSLAPLLFLWAGVAGLRPGPLLAWLPPAAAAVSLARRWQRAGFRLPPRRLPRRLPGWPALAGLAVMGTVFIARFWPVRGLPAGLWGDSLQHTMIVQLMLDNGGLFTSWQPYAELTTFTYHFGFHAWAAVFGWGSGLPAAGAVLRFGQILNGVSVCMLVLLARFLSRSPWAGVLTLLAAGLLLPVPSAYANWGRYTQLAGQALLPAALVLSFAYLQSPNRSRGLLALNALVWAALALTHYRVLALAPLALPGYLLLMVPSGGRRQALLRLAQVGLAAAALFLPWLLRLFGGKLVALLVSLAQNEVRAGFSPEIEAVGSLSRFAAPGWWLAAGIAAAWALWTKNRPFLVFFMWWALIVAAANPGLLLLPGDGIITNFAALIAVYILIAPTTGAFFGGILSRLLARAETLRLPALDEHSLRLRPLLAGLAAAAMLPAAVLGGVDRMRDIRPAQYALLTWPDERAFRWIDQNLRPDARFVVNSFLAFYDSVTVGSDGGWWLALRTGRASSAPPINSGFEQGAFPGYQQWVNALVRLIQDRGIGADEVVEELGRRGLTHVYIGQTHSAENMLVPQVLLDSPRFELVYHHDRVWIFEIVDRP